MNEIKVFVDATISNLPLLADDINDAYRSMLGNIEAGAEKENEEDLFYWYVNKLKNNLAGEI